MLTKSTVAASRAEELAMEYLRKSYRKEDIWQVRRGGEWVDLPKGYEPGWFYDELYRRKPDQGSNAFGILNAFEVAS